MCLNWSRADIIRTYKSIFVKLIFLLIRWLFNLTQYHQSSDMKRGRHHEKFYGNWWLKRMWWSVNWLRSVSCSKTSILDLNQLFSLLLLFVTTTFEFMSSITLLLNSIFLFWSSFAFEADTTKEKNQKIRNLCQFLVNLTHYLSSKTASRAQSLEIPDTSKGTTQ